MLALHYCTNASFKCHMLLNMTWVFTLCSMEAKHSVKGSIETALKVTNDLHGALQLCVSSSHVRDCNRWGLTYRCAFCSPILCHFVIQKVFVMNLIANLDQITYWIIMHAQELLWRRAFFRSGLEAWSVSRKVFFCAGINTKLEMETICRSPHSFGHAPQIEDSMPVVLNHLYGLDPVLIISSFSRSSLYALSSMLSSLLIFSMLCWCALSGNLFIWLWRDHWWWSCGIGFAARTCVNWKWTVFSWMNTTG